MISPDLIRPYNQFKGKEAFNYINVIYLRIEEYKNSKKSCQYRYGLPENSPTNNWKNKKQKNWVNWLKEITFHLWVPLRVHEWFTADVKRHFGRFIICCPMQRYPEPLYMFEIMRESLLLFATDWLSHRHPTDTRENFVIFFFFLFICAIVVNAG